MTETHRIAWFNFDTSTQEHKLIPTSHRGYRIPLPEARTGQDQGSSASSPGREGPFRLEDLLAMPLPAELPNPDSHVSSPNGTKRYGPWKLEQNIAYCLKNNQPSWIPLLLAHTGSQGIQLTPPRNTQEFDVLVQAIRLMAPEQEIRLSFRGFPRNPSGWPVLLDALSQQKNFKSLNIEFDEADAQQDIEGMAALLAGTLTLEQLEINVVPADDDEIPVLDWQGFFDALRCNRSLKKLDINYRSLKVVNVHSVNGNAKFFADLFQALASNSTLEHLALHDENFQHGCVSTRALANLLDANKLIRVSGLNLCPLNAEPFSRSCCDAREGVINLKSIDLDWNTGTKNFIELFKGRQSGAFVQVGDFRWRCEDSALTISSLGWDDEVMWEESLQDFLDLSDFLCSRRG